jgi:tight adherence protein B
MLPIKGLRWTIGASYFLSFLCSVLSIPSISQMKAKGSGFEEIKKTGKGLANRAGCRMVAGALLGWPLGRHWGALIGAMVVFLVPSVIASRKRRREKARLEMQLLDGLSLMQGGLRAGFNLFQVLELVTREMEPPLATIANQIRGEVQLGVPMDIAWERAGAEVSSEVFSELVTAVVIQREMGGDLGFILGTLRESLRQRINLRTKLKSVTSQGKLTGIVVSILPVALAGIIHLVMPQFIEPLFVNPLGQVLVGVAFSLEVVGAWMISRICRIDT